MLMPAVIKELDMMEEEQLNEGLNRTLLSGSPGCDRGTRHDGGRTVE